MIGSVADEGLVRDTMQGCDLVFHQAAHKAVLRSVERPLITDTVNTHGTLTILKAALDAGVGRVVHASSSSVYGGRGDAADHRSRTDESPLAVRGVEARGRALLPDLQRLVRPRDGGAPVLQRLRRPPTPRRDLCRRDPAVRRRARCEGTTQSCTATGSSRATSPTSATSSTPTSPRPPRRRTQCAGRVYNIAGGEACTLLDVLRILGDCSESFRIRSSSSRGPATCATAAPTRARPRAISGSAPASASTTVSRLTVDWLRPVARRATRRWSASAPSWCRPRRSTAA